MAQVFFPGPMRHAPLRRAVLGADVPVREAALKGWSVRCAEGDDRPVLAPGGEARGQLATLAGDTLARADWYEALFDSARVPCTLSDGTAAEVHRPRGASPGAAPWSLDGWVRKHGRAVVLTAEALMERFPEPPGDVAVRLGAIRRRAEARLRAGGGPGAVTVARSQRLHDAFYELLEQRWSVPLLDGSGTQMLDRTTLAGFDAAIVLPWDRRRDRVLVVRQFRAALAVRGERDAFSTEPIAGLIDPGETPAEAARREAREEAGLTLDHLHPVGEGYPTPGGTSEYHFLFIGECDLPDGTGGIGGLDVEGEDIEATVLPAARLVEDAVLGRLRNAPLHLLALALDRMRR